MEHSDMVEDQLSSMAKLVRRIYFAERRRFVAARQGRDEGDLSIKVIAHLDGGEDSRGVRFVEPFWPRLAKFILDHQLEPTDYIRSVFDRQVGNKVPDPGVFLRDQNVHQMAQLQRASKEEVRIRFDGFLMKVNFEIKYRCQVRGDDQKLVTRQVIRDPGLEAEPIFRYCAAMLLGQFDMAGDYYEEALLQYVLNTEVYEEVLGKHLNDQFHRDAQRLRLAVNVA